IDDLFDGANTGAFTIGLLVALYSASRGFAAVVRAIDVAYDHPDRRGWVGARAVGLAMALGTAVVGVFVVLILVIGPLFGSGSDIAESLGAGGAFVTVWDWLRWPVALAVLVVWASTLYHVAPNQHTPWRYDVPGALMAMAMWVLATWGFTLYLRFASEGANAVFGLLGGAISLILWFYLLAMGLLAGAEVNAILAHETDVGRARRTVTLRDLAGRARDLIDGDEPDRSDG
ncbi:MAG: YihY/virulence factor BrkB family protein, partial [Acidimicrobiia bacterium]|nr:YihY/virulence factor BrkB family protein [Acidimicrobiia bacterium]